MLCGSILDLKKTPRRANGSPLQNVAASRGHTSHSLRQPACCDVTVSAVQVATSLPQADKQPSALTLAF